MEQLELHMKENQRMVVTHPQHPPSELERWDNENEKSRDDARKSWARIGIR